MQFSDTELAIIKAALRAALDQYATDAAACDRDNQPRLAEQFRRQREQAFKLAQRIAEEVG
jgi:hypothetical protein